MYLWVDEHKATSQSLAWRGISGSRPSCVTRDADCYGHCYYSVSHQLQQFIAVLQSIQASSLNERSVFM
jgi:hypothetical protein